MIDMFHEVNTVRFLESDVYGTDVDFDSLLFTTLQPIYRDGFLIPRDEAFDNPMTTIMIEQTCACAETKEMR